MCEYATTDEKTTLKCKNKYHITISLPALDVGDWIPTDDIIVAVTGTYKN